MSLNATLTEEGVLEEHVPRIPLGVKGDFCLRMRNVNPRGTTLLHTEPKFQNNTYYYNRTRLWLGERVHLGWLLKRGSAGPAVTWGNVQSMGVFKYAVQIKETGAFDNMVAGNYRLCYGQGLVFYDALGEFVRAAKVNTRKPKPDYTSGNNGYLKGLVVQASRGIFSADIFSSQKALDGELNPDGSVNMDLYQLRESLGEVQDESGLEANDTFYERIFGARFSCGFSEKSRVGLTGAQSFFSRLVNPEETSYSYAHVYRGKRNSVTGADFDFYCQNVNFFGELAHSWSTGPGIDAQKGMAWTVTSLLKEKPMALWVSLFDYDAHFFSPHGKGVSFEVLGNPEAVPDNQRGMVAGWIFDRSSYYCQINYALAKFPRALGKGQTTTPVHASFGRQIYVENRYALVDSFDVYFRCQRKDRDVLVLRTPNEAGAAFRQQVSQTTDRFRVQFKWHPSGWVRYLMRWESRIERTPSEGERASGRSLMGDVQYRPTQDLMLNARVYFFNSPQAYLTTGSEEIWDNIYYFQLAGGLGSLRGTPGSRYYFIVQQNIGTQMKVWMKYDVNRRPKDLSAIQVSQTLQETKAFAAARHGFHLQIDYKW